MSPTTVGIVTLPGFNEIDSFVATRMIDSVDGLTVELIGPDATAVSMAGVEVFTPGSFDDTERHAAILVGSGNQTFDHLENEALMASMRFGSDNQLVGSQCSGAAILHRLGLVDGVPVCTDRFTAPKLIAAGVDIIEQSFRVDGNIATAGGCLSSAYLAFWVIAELVSADEAATALEKVAPVGEEQALIERARAATAG
jgi:transcriptional regulator GlxA family with amidase domain